MSDPVSPLAAASQLVSMTAAMAKLLEDNEKNEKDQSLGEIMVHMRGEATRVVQQTGRELRELYEVLGRAGVLGKPLNELTKDLKWYNWRTRHRLNAARDKFYEMHRVLTGFMDDVTAVLVCNGATASASGAFEKNATTKQTLDAAIGGGKSVGDILGEMIKASDDVGALLLGGKK